MSSTRTPAAPAPDRSSSGGAGGASQPSAAAAGIDERIQTKGLLGTFLARPEIGALVGAIVVALFFAIAAPSITQAQSISTVLYGASTIGIMAVGVSLLMIGGEFDLSTGVAVITSALAGSMFSWFFAVNVWVGVFMALGVSLLIGLINGVLLVRTKLPSFIVTLATFLMLTGLNLALTRLISGSVSSPSISTMDGFDSAKAIFASSVNILGVDIKITVFYWIALVLIATFILLKTKVGNWIFAVGGDENASRAVGVPVAKTKIGLFMGVGLCGWLLGMHNLFAFDAVQSGEGVGNEFLYIIAAVIGGCLLTGGFGSAIGGALGALIFGIASRGIVYAEWNPDWFKFFLGLMLLLATIVNMYVRKRIERK
ncbi:ABC transporter permease [Kocuria sp. SM24M-10]|uniref:ABC transporter permease n=1 Tax=Kocuria sp. SM24M-10 TaxID=1660349 RepID=UPI000A3E348E|nr:ABC transporter permease [Kocuria sp. SM24M-10]